MQHLRICDAQMSRISGDLIPRRILRAPRDIVAVDAGLEFTGTGTVIVELLVPGALLEEGAIALHEQALEVAVDRGVDGRLVLVIPWMGKLMLGTTDSEVLFHLALTLGLEDDHAGALARAIGRESPVFAPDCHPCLLSDTAPPAAFCAIRLRDGVVVEDLMHEPAAGPSAS